MGNAREDGEARAFLTANTVPRIVPSTVFRPVLVYVPRGSPVPVHQNSSFGDELLNETVDLVTVEPGDASDIGVHQGVLASSCLPSDHAQHPALRDLPLGLAASFTSCAPRQSCVNFGTQGPVSVLTSTTIQVAQLAFHSQKNIGNVGLRALAQAGSLGRVDLRMTKQVLQYEKVVHAEFNATGTFFGDKRAKRR